jgi:Putative beta barrel porin-7 (BBP7)
MSINARMVGAVGLLWMVSGTLLTAAAAETADTSAEWGQPCNLPTVTSNAPAVHDAQVQLVSENEPATDNPGCAVCGDSAACCTCCYDPLWDVYAGAVFLNRSRPDPAIIATPSIGPGSIVNGSDFTFDWKTGFEVDVKRKTESGCFVEARYLDDPSSQATFDVPNVTTFRMAGIGITILGGGFVDSIYTTTMQTAEVNVGLPLCEQFSFIAGFRWLQLDDDLRVNTATTSIFTNWDDLNRLYGGQIGFEVNFSNPENRLQFMGALKGGVFGDSAENTLTSRIVSGDFTQGTSTAFVSELDFDATYRLTKHFSVRGGYMLLWIQDVALADEAAHATHQVAGGSSSPVVTDGKLWYNGADVALECKF